MLQASALPHLLIAGTLALAVGAALPLAAQTSSPVLLVRVGDATTGAFVPAAEVRLPGIGVRVRTDSLGEVRIPGVAPGEHRLEVRRLGFAPLTMTAELSGRDTMDIAVLLQPAAQSLEAVAIHETFMSPGLREFEARRQRHIGGHFVTAEELRADGHSLDLVFAKRLPGVYLARDRFLYAKAYSSRGPNGLDQACQVAVHVDGVRLSDGDFAYLPPEWIAGIEYHPPGFVPPQYRVPAALELDHAGSRIGYRGGSSACGVLLLWTGG